MSDTTPTPNTEGVNALDEISGADIPESILANSPMMKQEGYEVPTPESEEVQEEADEEIEEAEELDEDSEEEADEAETDEDDDSEEITEGESDLIDPEEIDLEARTTVVVDGESIEVSFGDLIGSYQQEAHFGKKGRELGESRKALEEERAAKLGELESMIDAANLTLQGTEQVLAQEYHDLKTKLDEMDEDDFDYDRAERQVERKQKEYWQARNEREGLVEAVQKQRQEDQAAQWNAQVEKFYEGITEVIPEWTPEYNEEIKNFAIGKGIPEDFLNFIVDPNLVKIMDDYRKSEQNLATGAVKRKAAVRKRSIPTKKSKSQSERKDEAKQTQRQKVLSDNATPEEQQDFLRGFAERSLANRGVR